MNRTCPNQSFRKPRISTPLNSVIIIHNSTPIFTSLLQAIPFRQVLLLRPTLRIKIRRFSLAANPHRMSPMRRKPIRRRVILRALASISQFNSGQREASTHTNPIIPKRNIIFIPLKPSMQLRTRRDNLIEIGNNMIALRFRHTDDLCYEAWVEEEGFPACYGVGADQGVGSSNGFAAHSTT